MEKRNLNFQNFLKVVLVLLTTNFDNVKTVSSQVVLFLRYKPSKWGITIEDHKAMKKTKAFHFPLFRVRGRMTVSFSPLGLEKVVKKVLAKSKETRGYVLVPRVKEIPKKEECSTFKTYLHF